jgi:hypothetical protein
VAALTVETNSADSDTGMTASTAIATATSAANDDLNNGQLLIAELKNVRERYVQGVRTSTTANIAFGEVLAIRYNGKKLPTTQSTTTVAHSISVLDA